MTDRSLRWSDLDRRAIAHGRHAAYGRRSCRKSDEMKSPLLVGGVELPCVSSGVAFRESVTLVV
jgi:hypothetical protein